MSVTGSMVTVAVISIQLAEREALVQLLSVPIAIPKVVIPTPIPVTDTVGTIFFTPPIFSAWDPLTTLSVLVPSGRAPVSCVSGL